MSFSNSTPSSGLNTPARSGSPAPEHHKHGNHSVKQMWKDIKHAVAEHHREVNAAYQCYYGVGMTRTN